MYIVKFKNKPYSQSNKNFKICIIHTKNNNNN